MLKMAETELIEEGNRILSDLNEKLEFRQKTEREESSLHLSLFSREPPPPTSQQNNRNAFSIPLIVR